MTDQIHKETLAIIVSFNGGEKTIKTFRALSQLVDTILVVDNGSSAEDISNLRNVISYPHSVIELGENFGIGHALNIGVEYAKNHGFKWILTMDQDTIVQKSLLEKYQNFINTTPHAAILAPLLSIHGRPVSKRGPTKIEYAITSGNLVRLDVFQKTGLYNEELFIDKVDFEFCLRARKQGFDIFQPPGAIIFHELGNLHNHSTTLSKFYTAHSSIRRYYMSRNICYLATQYFNSFPILITKMVTSHILSLFAIWRYEDMQSARLSTKFMFRGIRDHFRRRYGPYKKE